MKEVRAMVVESAKSLATWTKSALARERHIQQAIYLRNTADVLLAVLGRKAQILVQSEADIVAVKSVRGQTQVEQMLFEGSRNGRFPGCRETSEPDGGTLLLAKFAALLAAKALVPCDVASGVLEVKIKNAWVLHEGIFHLRCHD